MGMPLKTKTFGIKSKIGDILEVKIEKVGTGEKADILYRISRGKDRHIAAPDEIVLFQEELEQLSEFLEADFLDREFPE